jgi:hypothetical protein
LPIQCATSAAHPQLLTIATHGKFSWLGIALLTFAFVAMLWNDRFRLLRPAVRVQAAVIGHRTDVSEGDPNYAAIYQFTANGAQHEVADLVYTMTKRPHVGTIRTLHCRAGRPDLARPPRYAFWIMVYGLVAGMAALLLAKLQGRVR